ncbi:hypothetical protein F5Y12DRAFT_193927 [Xylaria sp. FL1777]|nr:hypothetical protein F5Y12DRAFT_193927 [Xylaria sp. FL1777]
MSFQIKAFDLTPSEKHGVLSQIKSLVLGAGALIARAKKQPMPSPHDYSEALDLINRALHLATDPDACDPLLAPLATCYLYKGHILLALNHVEEAREAYEKAAASRTRQFTDAGASSRDEARRLLEQWDDTLSAAPRESPFVPADQGGFVDGTPGEMFMTVGQDRIALPVICRPGPARRPSVKTPVKRPKLL